MLCLCRAIGFLWWMLPVLCISGIHNIVFYSNNMIWSPKVISRIVSSFHCGRCRADIHWMSCNALCAPTILPNIRISWGPAPLLPHVWACPKSFFPLASKLACETDFWHWYQFYSFWKLILYSDKQEIRQYIKIMWSATFQVLQFSAFCAPVQYVMEIGDVYIIFT